MHASTLQGVLEHLRKLTDPARARELSDADLLERFRLRREEAAFTLLVQRHGPMVLAVCRRVLGDAHEAEDAFQATFLVLVRDAGTIRKQQSLSAWLHGVASRIAHKARRYSLRQRQRVGQAFQPDIRDDPSETLCAKELRTALDEEIERLPAKYRTPLILCYLADKTHEQAAKELGWPKSSVTARLAKARELLQRRLVRRGFTAPAGLLAALLTEHTANAMLPSLLTLSTIRLAVQALTGEALTATSAAALAGSFVKGAAVGKWAAVLTLLAILGFAAVVGSRLAVPGSSSKQEGPPPNAQAVGDPLPEGVVARIGSGRMRHGGYVSTLSFTSDGKSLLSGGVGTLCIWDTATGKRRRRFKVNTDWNFGFNFTAAGIAVASADKAGIVTVQIFDPVSGKVRRRVEMKERATYAPLVFSADGKRIAFTQGNTVRLCDAATGKEILRIPQRRPPKDIAFAPDGKTIALSNFTYITYLHDTTTGKCVREFKRDFFDTILNINIFSAVFSPDGRLLASIANPIRREEEPGKIIIWDVKTGIERQRLKAPSGWLLCAAFSPDSRYLAMGGNRPEVVLWEVATGKEVRRYPNESSVGSIAFSPDGKSLAAASKNGAIRLWDVATGRVLPASADPFLDIVSELRFSADGKRLIGHAAAYIAWEPASGREIRRFAKVSAPHELLPLSADEALLASADTNGTICLRDARTAKVIRALKGHKKTIWCMLFTADGHRLISSSADGTIRLWDVASGQELKQLPLGGEGTMRLAVSPDGRWLASANASRGPRGRYEIVLWDLAAGREERRFPVAGNNWTRGMAFSPDSRLLAAGSGDERRNESGTVQIWDVSTGDQRLSFAGHKAYVNSVVFSADGRMLATGATDGSLFVWELASGRKRHEFVGHEKQIFALAFSPDGRMLAASSYDIPVSIWDVAGTLEPRPRHLSNDELQRCWTVLAGEDAAKAFQAIRRLAAVPKQTLPLLREHLKPVPAPDLKRVRQQVAMLDGDDFSTRQKATEELEKHADAIASLLRQIIEKEKPSLEARRRLQQILEGIESSPESLRAVRAVEVLEWIATPEAMRLIDKLANGAADARLTREAVAARQRRRR